MNRRYDDKDLGNAIAAIVLLILTAAMFISLVFGVEWIN